MVDIFANGFAQHWDQLIDWETRKGGYFRFIEEIISSQGLGSILDCALGSGFDAIGLAQRGYVVSGVDISAEMIAVARKNAEQGGVDFQIRQADWVNLQPEAFGKFDCLIVLGNSLACELSIARRHLAMKAFSSLVRVGGLLIVDYRNYDHLDLSKNKKSICYAGGQVKILSISPNDPFHFVYVFPDGAKFDLPMSPVHERDLEEMAGAAGFIRERSYADMETRDFYAPTSASLLTDIFRRI